MFSLKAWRVLAFCFAPVAAKVVPFVNPGFFFDYDKAGAPVPIPVSEQCEILHLKWGRREANGFNPVAPYSLQVYTSTFITPFLIDAGDGLEFDWAVPFAPGTQYQICMFDSNGVPGGCQDTYTVIPNLSASEDALNCPNVTFDATLELNITGTESVRNGPISRFGFYDQCTDISIKPNAGTPPFTLTIAPPLHPPFNLTSNTMDAITWTVSLSRAMPFFMSMVSSEGLVWAAGPMHSGAFGPTDCLASGTVNAKRAHSAAVGAGVGGLFGGMFLGGAVLLGYLYWHRRREEMEERAIAFESKIEAAGYPQDDLPTLTIGAPLGLGSARHLSTDGYRSPSATSGISPAIASSEGYGELPFTPLRPSNSLQSQNQQVFVIHRDGGRANPAPVRVYEEDIVELPPDYRDQRTPIPPPVSESGYPSLRVLSGPRSRPEKRLAPRVDTNPSTVNTGTSSAF